MDTIVMNARWRRGAGLFAVGVAVLFCAVFGAGMAGASPSSLATGRQACDDAYGCPPTSPPPGPPVTCHVQPDAARRGDTVLVTVSNVEPGTEISVAIDGTVVARAIATEDGQGNQVAAALAPAGHLMAPQAPNGGAVIRFTVPSWLESGDHTIVAYGAGFSCSPGNGHFRVLDDQVAGESVERARSDSGGGGSLARTGMFIALLLAIALVLILVGYMLVQAERRRRRRRAREDNRLTV